MAGVLTTIKDANGKEISFDASKICDINGDVSPESPASVTDSKRNRVDKVHDIEYVDVNGKAIDNMQLLADMQAGNTSVTALDLSIEATHSGPNHNYCVYYEDSMEKDAETFVNPFKKPILKNHNDWSGEPMGRIQQAYHGPSELTDERSAIHLKVRVTDQDAIPKFLDGRYSTVSIGGTMGTVTCNICGKTILKDGKFKFCGHWRGETYKDQVCYWGAKDITYHEVSTVNNPADDFAQIMKVTVVTDKDKKEDSNSMGENGKDAKAEDVKKSLCDMIDQLLGKTTDSASAATPPDNTAGEGTAADNNNNSAGEGEQVQDSNDGQAQATDSAKEIEELKKQLEDANTAKEKAEKELKDAQAELAKAQEDLKAAQEETKQMTDMCMTLASANKEMIADGIIEKEKAAGKIKDDGVEARKKELVAMSMKELNKIAEEVPAAAATDQRTPGTVTNPGIADRSGDNKDGNGSTADTDKGTTDNNKRRSVNDVAADIVGKLFK